MVSSTNIVMSGNPEKHERCLYCGKPIPKIPAPIRIDPPIFSRRNGKSLLILRLFVEQHTCGDDCYVQYMSELEVNKNDFKLNPEIRLDKDRYGAFMNLKD